MLVINNLEELEQARLGNLVVALGNFDGVHLGHQKLLRLAVSMAQEVKGQAAVLTFDPHPLKVLAPDKSPKLLTTVEQRLRHFAALGIDIVILLPFTQELSELNSWEFVENILISKMKISHACVGFNYSFGKGGTAGAEDLKHLGHELGFGVSVVGPELVNGALVSSTEIRSCLEQGQIEQAKRYLGYWPSITGIVVSGDQRGRTLGFPTANVQANPDILIPALGVYAAWVGVNNEVFPSMVNIGYNPTFKETRKETIEAHLFDFDRDIYGESVEITFRSRLRHEQKFNGVQELVAQLKLDLNNACGVLKYVTKQNSIHIKEKLSI